MAYGKTTAIKLAACFGAATMVAGCTTGTGYNRISSLEEAARAMTQSDDVGIRATGTRILEDQHPEIKQEADTVRTIATPGETTCIAQKPEKTADGRIVVRLGNCTVTAPAPGTGAQPRP